MTAPAEKDPDLSRMVEETRVTAVTEFPGRVVLEALTADGQLVRLVFLPMMAHKTSDDLLRSAAMVKRAEVRPSI